MYLRKAENFQCPIAWIWNVDEPLVVANVAAPILKLWGMIWRDDRLQRARSMFRNCRNELVISLLNWDIRTAVLEIIPFFEVRLLELDKYKLLRNLGGLLVQ